MARQKGIEVKSKLITDPENRVPISELLQSDETSATVIHAIIRGSYGDDVYDWDPLTVCLELKDDYGVDSNPAVVDRWSAVQVLMGSDAFFKRIDAFLNICNTFSSGDPMFSAFNPVTLEELAWGLSEVGMNRDFLPFSHTIKAYVGNVVTEAGYKYGKFPPVFSEVFDKRPDAEDVRDGMAAMYADKNVGEFISGNIADMVGQFKKVPSLKGMHSAIIDDGIAIAMSGKQIAG